jgi:hypothetical protein
MSMNMAGCAWDYRLAAIPFLGASSTGLGDG